MDSKSNIGKLSETEILQFYDDLGLSTEKERQKFQHMRHEYGTNNVCGNYDFILSTTKSDIGGDTSDA